MKSKILLVCLSGLLLLVGGCVVQPIQSKVYVDISVFHKPLNFVGKTFLIAPGDGKDDLEFESYAERLSAGLVDKGLVAVPLDKITTNDIPTFGRADLLFFLRYRASEPRLVNTGFQTLCLKKYGVRIEVTDAHTLQAVSKMPAADADKIETSICTATINVGSYGELSESTAILMALGIFTDRLPFSASNPYQETLEKYLR